MADIGTSKRTNLLFLVALIFILGAAAFWIFGLRRSSPASPVSQTESPTVALAKDILRAVEELERLELNTALFSDPRFLRLEESKRPAPLTLPQGRKNPFLPF